MAFRKVCLFFVSMTVAYESHEIQNSATVIRDVSLYGNEDAVRALLLYSNHSSEWKGRGNYIPLEFVFFSESLQKVYVGTGNFALCMP